MGARSCQEGASDRLPPAPWPLPEVLIEEEGEQGVQAREWCSLQRLHRVHGRENASI